MLLTDKNIIIEMILSGTLIQLNYFKIGIELNKNTIIEINITLIKTIFKNFVRCILFDDFILHYKYANNYSAHIIFLINQIKMDFCILYFSWNTCTFILACLGYENKVILL